MKQQLETEFFIVCQKVKHVLEKEWRNYDDMEKGWQLEKEKKAILGYTEETLEYLEKIRGIIKNENMEDVIPPAWYRDLAEGVFAELYGFAGLSPWIYDHTSAYAKSSSAKLIGDRLYCFIDGYSQLQPQRISQERREQLKRALLMADPRERLEKGFHEIYLRNGIRVTIYSGHRTKKGQEIMVFRKYLLQELSFESLVKLETIPVEAIPLFQAMVGIGFNVIFAGPVRSGKTTFLQIWQCGEDPRLEGLSISTDPETPWHLLMEEAPIMQLVADGEELKTITKALLRGDNDYVLLEEMRDPAAFQLYLELTRIGKGRCKGTVHIQDGVMLPLKMAEGICNTFGGERKTVIAEIFQNIHFVFELIAADENHGRKKLKSIMEYCYDHESGKASVHWICRYDQLNDCWQWNSHLGEDKEAFGLLRREEMREMRERLNDLAKAQPMSGNLVIYPRYYEPNWEFDQMKGGKFGR